MGRAIVSPRRQPCVFPFVYARHGRELIVNLWGASPLYVNPVNGLHIDTSTSRRQGRNREGPSEGSRSAKR